MCFGQMLAAPGCVFPFRLSLQNPQPQLLLQENDPEKEDHETLLL